MLDEAHLVRSGEGSAVCRCWQGSAVCRWCVCMCVQVLVLDEADLLLSYGYEEDVTQLAPQVHI